MLVTRHDARIAAASAVDLGGRLGVVVVAGVGARKRMQAPRPALWRRPQPVRAVAAAGEKADLAPRRRHDDEGVVDLDDRRARRGDRRAVDRRANAVELVGAGALGGGCRRSGDGSGEQHRGGHRQATKHSFLPQMTRGVGQPLPRRSACQSRRYGVAIAIATRHDVRPGLVIVGCLLIAANLRPPITSVGPLVGDIRADTGMSSAAAGLLTTLPLLAFAGVSPWAARIARRIGIERALQAAVVVLVAGGSCAPPGRRRPCCSARPSSARASRWATC